MKKEGEDDRKGLTELVRRGWRSHVGDFRDLPSVVSFTIPISHGAKSAVFGWKYYLAEPCTITWRKSKAIVVVVVVSSPNSDAINAMN